VLASHGAQPRPCLASLRWLGWRQRAWRARRARAVLHYLQQRSPRTVSRSPPDCLDNLAGQLTDCLAMPVPECLAAPAVGPDCLVPAAELS
jgi:hypothetical protein